MKVKKGACHHLGLFIMEGFGRKMTKMTEFKANSSQKLSRAFAIIKSRYTPPLDK